MSRSLRRIASIALPIVGNIVAPGIGGIIGGAAGGALSGGGLRGALLGGATSALTAGLGNAIGTPGTAINWTSAAPGYSTGAQVVGGSGLLGGLSRAVNPSGVGQSLVQGAGRVAGALMPSGGGGGTGTVGAGTAGGGIMGSSIGNVASNVFSGIQGTQAYRDMQRQQLGANRQALEAISPFAASGTAANAQLSNLLGLSGNENNEELLNQMRNTPGYQFQLQQGQQAIDRAQASRGGFFSGEALKASQQYGQGLADQVYNDYVRNLQQQSAQGLGAAGGMANLYQQGGDIRANTTLARSNLLSETLANLLNPQQQRM